MSLKTTYLSFSVVDLHSCKLLGVVDVSNYLNANLIDSPTLQVVMPGYSPSGDVIELNYYPEGVTVIDSNVLGITNVDSEQWLQDLPDGLWTIKMSYCPFTGVAAKWYEKKFYRICQLQCKFNKAFLCLKLDQCNDCYPPKLEQQLDYIERLITGIQANVGDCNFKGASLLYEVANNLIDRILECACNDNC